MSGRTRITAYVSALALTTALGAVPAFAQDPVEPAAEAAADPAAEAATEPADAGPATDTGEIVVTAQKRAENVQDVPISIAAFSGDTLEKNNVATVEDLGKITPVSAAGPASAGPVAASAAGSAAASAAGSTGS